MAVNLSLVRFIAFFLGLIALIFLITATPTHHWYTGIGQGSKDNETSIYGGIFEDCFLNDDVYTCRTQVPDGYIKATKAFLILAIVGFIVVSIYLLIMAFTRGICFKVLGTLLLVTGMFTLVAMCIYTDKHTIHNAKSWKFGWSFTLGWISCVFTFLAGFVSFFANVDYDKL